MKNNDFLDSLDPSNREEEELPEPNVEGDFDCFDCREPVRYAFHDKSTGVLSWVCSRGHESYIKGFNV